MKITREYKKLILHPNEIHLIESIREDYRFGKITIIVQDGVPLRIESGIVAEDLSQNDEDRENV